MSWDDAIDGVDRETPGGRAPRAVRMAQRMQRFAAHAANDDPGDDTPAYAELHCVSDFSFLRGAASAEELFARAAQCGYEALAVTDECSLAGIVRAHDAARATGIKLVVGAEFRLECGLRCVLLVQDKAGYAALCRLITAARRAADKGRYRLTRADVERELALKSWLGYAPATRPDGEPTSMGPCVRRGDGSRVGNHPHDERPGGGISGEKASSEGREGECVSDSNSRRHARESGHPASLGCVSSTAIDGEPTSTGPCVRRGDGSWVGDHPHDERPGDGISGDEASSDGREGVSRTVRSGHARETGLFALWLPGEAPYRSEGAWLKDVFGTHAFLAVELHRQHDDARRLHDLLRLAGDIGLQPVASGDVHMATRRQRVLQDTVTAIRHGTTLAEGGAHLFPNGERHLRTRRALGNVYGAVPGGHALLQAAVDIARQCTFSMQDVKYVYPRELVPEGHTPASWLRSLTEQGMHRRWPEGVPAKVVAQIEEELALIAELQYEAFFLTVEDIVRFARSKNILCQGRGSSANSAVCYALGITAVDPMQTRLLIARFLSRARNEPPDIDVDFEHERREEVMQYVYAKYGRERAALAATVIRYRGKSAVRDVAKVFGMPPDQLGLLAECYGWGNAGTEMSQRLSESGFDIENPLVARVLAVTAMLEGKPRHLSQHVGGFIISDAPLWHLVPVENASMADRTVIQWEKDDLESLGLLKVDCLALGMLTCIRKALDLVRGHRGRDLELATIPKEDAQTYAMIQRADTVGVFQIESRAQMTMLPRLKPAKFYDLVVEVAIVRPGPIQGGMVHPYLQRRMGKQPVTYPSAGIEEILGPTLGVPLFQEQVMELVIHAGYTPAEADGLRRSMAAWRHGGDMEPHRLRIRGLMEEKGYDSAFIDQIFEQIKGFGSYGFPQSHAASFAGLVYASCWLKRHEPAAFACALLNAQPMGFYSPSQIVQDARRGNGERVGVEFLPVDVLHSQWDNTLVDRSFSRELFSDANTGNHSGNDSRLKPLLQKRGTPQPAIRLGFRQVNGMAEAVANAIVAARAQRPFADVADLCRRAGLDARSRTALAEAGALDGLAGHRNTARWQVAGVERAAALASLHSPHEHAIALPAPTVGEDVLADYRTTGLTLGAHPLSLLRNALRERRVLDSQQLRALPHGRGAFAAGLVTQRQRPATAGGTIFVTLEDEHGMVNVVVWQDLAARRRKALLGARLLGVRGRWEQVDGVQHLIARDLQDLSPLLGGMHVDSRDFR
jgi:error-prone DNA polymerase